MIITNHMKLPKAFVEMASEEYTPKEKEYRVTSLLKGIRETILIRRYQDKIEQDVSDMIWLLIGKAAHHILEQQQESESELKEERIRVKIGEYTISGQFDLYCADQKKITDYKTTSVWKIIYKDFEDWRKQLLIYSWMIKQIGFEVKLGEVVAILKDHSKRDAKNKSDYPPLPVHVVRFSFSEQDFVSIESFLRTKIENIAVAENLTDEELPLCTPEERYNTGDKYAVMKKGRKTALRVFDSIEEAETWKAENQGDYIEHRPGKDTKCLEYCLASKFCNYYQKLVAKEGDWNE